MNMSFMAKYLCIYVITLNSINYNPKMYALLNQRLRRLMGRNKITQ